MEFPGHSTSHYSHHTGLADLAEPVLPLRCIATLCVCVYVCVCVCVCVPHAFTKMHSWQVAEI